MRKYYVFRIAKGFDSGEPGNACPVDFKEDDVDDIFTELEQTDIDKIPYDTNNYKEYLQNEFWICGKLRQGWGTKGLDLNSCSDGTVSKKWIKNFIISSKRDWGVIGHKEKEYCHIATGRYNILKHMQMMRREDIIIIPKHSYENRHDNKRFVVCEVLSPYYFDLNDNYKDFGHVIQIKIIGTFEYEKKSIIQKDFQGYQKAINRIKKTLLIKKINSLIS